MVNAALFPTVTFSVAAYNFIVQASATLPGTFFSAELTDDSIKLEICFFLPA